MSLDIERRDTICALSSAQGYGAIAIVRASGPRAQEIFSHIFRRELGEIKASLAMHGHVVNNNGDIIDDVMAIFFLGKKSFTGESSFEIYCHGNHLIIDQILQTICSFGARLATPGEFSMRAMLNGKIDLAQAESIVELIHAKSHAAKQAALIAVRGGLREKTAHVREIIVSVLAEIEARMDFPDEDLGGYPRHHLLEQLQSAIASLEDLLKNASFALRLHEGVRIVICGLPNAGKSTLLNLLVGEQRAIVHEIAGTTRDVIEANFILGNVPITLVDVAGVRDTAAVCAIEKIGIERALGELKKAHIVIWLADAMLEHPFSSDVIKNYLNDLNVPVVHVLNKIELVAFTAVHNDTLKISATTGYGIAGLKNKLHALLTAGYSETGELFITKARQRDQLIEALTSLKLAKDGLLQGMVDEIITSELRGAGLAFDRLFGTELSEDILDKIFSQFCIGK